MAVEVLGLCSSPTAPVVFSTNGSSSDVAGTLLLEVVSIDADPDSLYLAVLVAGSGFGNVPVTISANQSPSPPGAASIAV